MHDHYLNPIIDIKYIENPIKQFRKLKIEQEIVFPHQIPDIIFLYIACTTHFILVTKDSYFKYFEKNTGIVSVLCRIIKPNKNDYCWKWKSPKQLHTALIKRRKFLIRKMIFQKGKNIE